MQTLEPNECRVLGVLIEKAQTTPGQYPLTLNSMVTGSNQKSNRHPVMHLDEDTVFDTVESLRHKELAREVQMTGSRVAKYRHTAREGLEVTTSELVLLTELLLRGPQTVGELRGRASRMHPIESLEVAQTLLDGLMGRDEPMVRRIGPAPGSRADRYLQLLCPDLHPLDAAPAPTEAAVASPASPASPDLAARVERLEREVRQLGELVQQLTARS